MTWQEWDRLRAHGTLKDSDVATLLRDWAAREEEFRLITERLENDVCVLAARAAANETLLRQEYPC